MFGRINRIIMMFFKRLCYLMASRCWCCVQTQEETLSHLFFNSYAARKVWHYFLSCAGIALAGLTLHQDYNQYCKLYHRLLFWKLWKRRNSYKYGDAVSVNRVIYKVSSSLQCLVICRKPRLQNISHK